MIPHRPSSRSPNTPRAAGLAGCVVSGRRAAPALALLVVLVAVAGCGRGDGPRVRVVNESGRRLSELWVCSQHDSVRVPSLAPGESVEVRPRVTGEDLLWLSGRFAGRRIDSHGGDYVEATGGYRFRATVDSAGRAEMRFIRLALW